MHTIIDYDSFIPEPMNLLAVRPLGNRMANKRLSNAIPYGINAQVHIRFSSLSFAPRQKAGNL